MSTTRIYLTVDETAKEEALKLFQEIGMDASTAVNIYFKAVARMHKIPFDLALPEEADDIFSMNSSEFMDRARAAVANRNKSESADYVISMDIEDGKPYKLYSDGRREYIEE